MILTEHASLEELLMNEEGHYHLIELSCLCCGLYSADRLSILNILLLRLGRWLGCWML